MHPLWSVLTIVQDLLLWCSGSQVMGVRRAQKCVLSLYCSLGFANLVVLFHTIKIKEWVCINICGTWNLYVGMHGTLEMFLCGGGVSLSCSGLGMLSRNPDILNVVE